MPPRLPQPPRFRPGTPPRPPGALSPPGPPNAAVSRPVVTRRQRVFISHSSKNKPLADAVARHLEGHGIACWIAPRDIKPGANYGVALLDGLSSCQVMLLLLTEDSNTSQFVMKEAERAISRKIPILVARFQPIAVSRELEFYISTSQFLEATSPPPQQHFNGILAAVRDVLASASPVPIVGDTMMTRPRESRVSPHLGVFLAGLGLLAVTVIAAGVLAAPRIGAFITKSSTPEPPSPHETVPPTADPHEAPIPPDTPTVAGTTSTTVEVEPPQPARQPAKPTSPLAEAFSEQDHIKGTLAALAKARLANFHREVLIISKNGQLTPNRRSGDREVMASCKIQPNMNRYTSLASELIALLDKSAQDKGVIKSDGMKTSEDYGHDARPHIEAIARQSLSTSDGLLDIFASSVHERLVEQHAGAGHCPYVSFATPFLLYDGSLTIRADNGEERPYVAMAGVEALQYGIWSNLLQQQGTGIVVILESTRNSFRHTTWRWFHLSPADWTTLATNLPWQFRCVLTLTDSSGAAVESDSYPLKQYGVGLVGNDRIVSLAPFFVNKDFEHYIPEITLTKSIVVLEDDVRRVEDFTATIEEVHGRAD